MSTAVLRKLATRVPPVLRGPGLTQRASLFSKPAKSALGPAETAIGLGMFALAILGPSGWILANLESYKHKN